MNWYNFPSIVSCTIIWNVKSYMVTNKCYFRSYVIFLLILPLHHLKYKSITLMSVMQDKITLTYCKAHFQVFGDHKVTVVPVVPQILDCEVDLSTVLTRMLTRFLFLCYPNSTKVGGRQCSVLIAKGKCPSIYDFKLVRKIFQGTTSADKL